MYLYYEGRNETVVVTLEQKLYIMTQEGSSFKRYLFTRVNIIEAH